MNASDANVSKLLETLEGASKNREIHVPYHNFMGPGTRVEDRLSLNYDGKRGTKNYFIPTTYSDLVSFEHDLMYWSPTSSVKAWSDNDYLNDIRSVMGLFGIGAQYLKRYGLASIYTYGAGLSAVQGVKSIASDLNNIREGVNVERMARNVLNTAREVQRGLEENERLRGARERLRLDPTEQLERAELGLGQMPEPAPLPEIPFEERLVAMERGEVPVQRGLEPTMRLTEDRMRDVRRQVTKVVLYRLMPKLLITGYMVAPRILDSVKEVYKSIIEWGFKNPEYEEVKDRVDNVRNKYERYLTEIGNFEDAPWYRSLIRSIDRPEGEQFFKVKKDIDKERAKELYIDFYNEFEDYQKFMNNKYKDVKGYVPFDIKELNMDNLDKVYNIESVPSSFIEDVYEKVFKRVEKDKDKYTDKEQEKINELNNEIEKVLKGEQDKPFETPAIVKDDKDDKIEIDVDIPTLLQPEADEVAVDEVVEEEVEEVEVEVEAVAEEESPFEIFFDIPELP